MFRLLLGFFSFLLEDPANELLDIIAFTIVFVAQRFYKSEIDLLKIVLSSSEILNLHLQELDSVEQIGSIFQGMAHGEYGVAFGQENVPSGGCSVDLHGIKIIKGVL